MRDIVLTLLVCGSLPLILRYPWIGVLAFAWLSLVNPYAYTWGFAKNIPWVMIVAVTTMMGMVLHRRDVRLPINSITILLMLLPLWMTVTLLFALEPADAYEKWKVVIKQFFFILVAASLVQSKKQLLALLWVIVLSVGFFGVKGGMFTLLVGGQYKVFGPAGGNYIADNNAISIALIMTIPLMLFLSSTVSSKWVKWGMYAASILSGIAVLGSQSRGAFLAILAALLFIWLNSRRKLVSGLVLVALVPLAIGFMPEKWTDRMETIETYEEDSSAMGRVYTWQTLFNLANDRPLVGAGFEPYSEKTFARYAPHPGGVYSAHSIYFQMLGEHGYVGLGLFLALGIAVWRLAAELVRVSRGRPDLAWTGNLARASQVSLVGFAVGGMFVNIAYWELQYYEIIILMAAHRLASGVAPASAQGTVEPKPSVIAT
jgi:probable O-glycosylation ligase (exosortase A-associated)